MTTLWGGGFTTDKLLQSNSLSKMSFLQEYAMLNF